MSTLRVIKVLVQPVCVVDDGDTLAEIEVGAIEVPYGAWDTFDLHSALAPARVQVENAPAVIPSDTNDGRYADGDPSPTV